MSQWFYLPGVCVCVLFTRLRSSLLRLCMNQYKMHACWYRSFFAQNAQACNILHMSLYVYMQDVRMQPF